MADRDYLQYDNERIDDLQIKGRRIIQKTDGFCFGMDAVLLSDYARVKAGSRVVDLCSGTGIVPILIEAKYPVGHVEGLEYFPEYVEMAGRSIRMNRQEDKVSMREGDVKEARRLFAADSADYVTCNPPYMTENHGLINPDFQKAAARHELLCSFGDVADAARWILRQGGHFILVHRPFRLAEIISELKQRKLEPKRMRLVYPYVDKEPNMVLLDCVNGGRQRMTVDPPLIVYNKDGSYTPDILKIYHLDGDNNTT